MIFDKTDKSSVQLCIHGHFYQPPRENPFTGLVPNEPGAEPYNNFNEKITAECYRPNAQLGNFKRMSFNLGPTLAAWMEKADPETYDLIIKSDQAVYEKLGYGNALAQVYNHAILPLTSPHDIEVQIDWGIADFERRFGHKPEGMWLAETAVNSLVLEKLVDAGIKFTILAPWQAHHDSVETIDLHERMTEQVRLRTSIIHSLKGLFNDDHQLAWAAATALERAYISESFDPTEPYLVKLRGGKSITVFFYNAPLSGGVSFDQHATTDADSFIKNWIMPQINSDKLERGIPQLIMLATDGELYGHHQSYRDYFLERLTTYSADNMGLSVTFPSRWLRTHLPHRKVRIVENSSWSCFHGVRRWGAGCECTPGDTSWKTHLRAAFDVLSNETDRIFKQSGNELLLDPQNAIREWMPVFVGMADEMEFCNRHLKFPTDKNWQRARRLLMAQVYKHQMYTSCAWFFEDLDRIEPKNALASAAITVKLLGRMANHAVIDEFESHLEKSVSNRRPHHYNGLQLYHRGVRASHRHTEPGD